MERTLLDAKCADQPRKDQPRTYALNKKDAKMVSDAAKKKL